MITRISDNARYSTIAGNIANLQDGMAGISGKLNTLKKINQPSDDPEGTTMVLNLRAAGAAIDQYKDNIVSGNAWLKVTELNLNSIDDLLMQAQGVAQSLGTAYVERTAAADSIQNISNQLLSLANTQLGGRYIFSGSKTDTKPFTEAVNGAPPPAHLYNYNGDHQSLLINIGQSYSTGYNITGGAVFSASAGGGVAFFETLDALRTILQDASSTDADVSAALANFQGAGQNLRDQVQDNINKTSIMLGNLEFADNHLTYLKNNVADMISKRENADITKLAMEFQMQGLALNASYSVTAKINEGNILNFLK